MREKRLMWPVRALCRLSGEDAWIILHAETDAEVVGKFAVIGLMVLVIFFVSVYSSVHFLVNLLNGNHFVAVVIGLFWGAMIANIYYLLLFTITPPILKGRERAEHGVRKEVTTEKRLLAALSLLFRFLFVILLAVVIAQPWLVTIFNTSRFIERDRQKYRVEFLRLAEDIGAGGNSSGLPGSRERDRREIERLLVTNNFYTRKIQLINRSYPTARLVTSIVVLLFVIPLGLKYWIRGKSNFYEIRKELEKDIVRDQYVKFKDRYTMIFAERFGTAAAWYESCTDPPFNTLRKEEERQHLDQQQLLDGIYGDGEDSDNNKYILHETVS